MSVCVLYARKDAAEIPPAIERMLSPSVPVWWDKKIRGDYRVAIRKAIAAATCVVPIWSRLAEKSSVMHDELEFARRHKVPILPIAIHANAAPLGWGPLQAVEMLGWTGDINADGVLHLKDAIITAFDEARRAKNRPSDCSQLGTRLPAYFYSVSSHETQIEPSGALDLLRLFQAKEILVSAYDFLDRLDSAAALRSLLKCRKSGARVLLDSGNYEKYRRGDKTWTLKLYRKALDRVPHDLAFTYDKVDAPTSKSKAIEEAIRAFERDSKSTGAPVIPIVHLPIPSDEERGAEVAAEVMFRVAKNTHPAAIAVPERELGNGLFARVRTIRAIRIALHKLPYYQVLHILGTGTPMSVAMFTGAGADSFDGLEWCRYSVDAESNTLHHFHLYDLFEWQDKLSSNAAVLATTVSEREEEKAGYVSKAALHNLEYYSTWTDKLRDAAPSNTRLVAMLARMLGEDASERAGKVLPEVFDNEDAE